MIEDGIDVAIHSGDLSDSSLIVKKIAETSVATPTYLEKHGVPKHPSEFDGHRTVMFMHPGSPREWPFENKSGRIVRQPKGAFRTNDGEHVRIAVLAHLGIPNTPARLFAKEIASGSVCRLLPEYEQPKSIFALRPGGRRPTTKVRVLIEFLEATFPEDLATITEYENPPIHHAEVTR